ncbi:DNA mismatch repair protein Mlh1 [Diplogelasinospora grovesii]|uniref:DNA mismatch repair protein Mlh1 n=1 Tax=Diplogelasinospora grovesii TaxID=303347 RepID=A0AAN6NIY6_9PEZI|nr:DNA mismatch repair protein Mlh1 [Diplogelasinospora grovesii]
MADAMDVDAPRGTKRKADDVPDDGRPRRIQALDPDVVNKIAAGEIIVAPVHALKELIENAVDAGATSLEILVKDGGLKLLQITDNGCGIEKEDLPILCERFTTSKLQKFEDLQSIATYGFRGEALASISHIAHLTVTTKTKDSQCAWKAWYSSGKLVPSRPGQSAEPKATAGRQGTQITVEDLFYNVPTRKRAFRSPGEEFNKIADMVGRYAIHCKHVALSLKKHGESSTSIAIQANASVSDRIRQIYKGNIANELIEFATSDNRWGFKADGLATNANYHHNKLTFLLFINHRSVESSNIKKAIEQTYSAFLPKNGHPFVYLSLEINPQRIDVNVHPTKREVNFLNEDEIMQAICEHLRSKLAAVDTSRTYHTQTLLTGPADVQDVATPIPPKTSRRTTSSRPYENNLVRTDTNMRKITSMLLPATTQPSPSSGKGKGKGKSVDPDMVQYETEEREAVVHRLTSLRELREAVLEDKHDSLTDIFANHTFVGVVDERRRLAAIQGGVKLYLVDYGRVCFEYFYQVGLTDFGRFGVIRFTTPLDLRHLLKLAAENEKQAVVDRIGARGHDDDESDFDVGELVEAVAEQLIERRELLQEYFSLEISPAGELLSIPLLVRGYTPPLVKLPAFLLRLGPKVNWRVEKPCFQTFLKELASFYVPEQLPPSKISPTAGSGGGGGGNDSRAEGSIAGGSGGGGGGGEGEGEGGGEAGEEEDEVLVSRRNHVRRALEHVLFPAFKAKLVATKSLMQSGGVIEAADLKRLYTVFERC